MKRADLNVWMQFSYFFDYVPVFSKKQHMHVLPTGYRVFLVGDRRTKCLGGDRQRTVWCLQQHQLCYLRNRRPKCALTVSCRRPGKLGCRSNSPSFCAAQATSHVSSELCTFRCLVGHVWQICGPVSRNTVGTMVDVCHVMVAHTIIITLFSFSYGPLNCVRASVSNSYHAVQWYLCGHPDSLIPKCKSIVLEIRLRRAFALPPFITQHFLFS
jgi:hypothetical protein